MVTFSVILTIIGLLFTFGGLTTGLGRHYDYDDSSLTQVVTSIFGIALIIAALILCYSACYT
jgi:uncharacterized membrane protein